ncbi:MAG TPA: hypothetical protein VEA37_08005, partial [Flavobacterium sp.]|nr:hypothetical protein [Flavobacterium sp.]
MAVTYSQIASNKRKTIGLITGFLIFIIALGWLFSYNLGDPSILVASVIFSVAMSFFSYYYSDKMVLGISKA